MRRMDLRRIARAADRARRARERAEQTHAEALDVIVEELLATDGERPNIQAAANVSGIARTTIYRALKARRDAAQAPASRP